MKKFIHIPKSAGSSVRAMTLGNPDWDYASHRRKLSDPDVDTAVFTLRDPIQRFLSAAKHLTSARTKRDMESYGNAEDFVEKLKSNSLDHIIFKPMSHWLGTLEQYQQHEHRVASVIDIDSVDDYFTALGVTPQRKRSAEDYQIDFDDTLSAASVEWLESYYAEDRALYEYIKTRPYYVSGEQ